MQSTSESFMNLVQTCAQAQTTPEAGPSQSKWRRKHSCPQHSTKSLGTSRTNPKRAAVHVVGRVNCTAQLAGTNSQSAEEPRQYGAALSLIWYHVCKTWLVV